MNAPHFKFQDRGLNRGWRGVGNQEYANPAYFTAGITKELYPNFIKESTSGAFSVKFYILRQFHTESPRLF